jgi:YjbE family integral membrane protein
VGSSLQYLDPSYWEQLLQESSRDLDQATFWIAALRIVLINIVLSGDNAMVIAMACRGLPRRQRFWGLLIGAGAAVILLIVLTVTFAKLIELPYLKLAGGLALFYIAAKLLLPEDADQTGTKAEAQLWRAVRIVLVADLIMSFDNIIAVATAAKGNVALLAVGLTVSIPIIVAGAAIIMALLDRFPILIWIGSALLGWVAGDAIATDRAVSGYLIAAAGENFAHEVEWMASAAGIVLVIAAGTLWRRSQLTRTRTPASGGEAGGS